MSVEDARAFVAKLDARDDAQLQQRLKVVNDQLVTMGNTTQKPGGGMYNFTREQLRQAFLERYGISGSYPDQTANDDTCFAFSETPGF